VGTSRGVAGMPLWIAKITQTNNEITLRWQGGRGRYQLQACRTLASSQWQNLGPQPPDYPGAENGCLSRQKLLRLPRALEMVISFLLPQEHQE